MSYDLWYNFQLLSYLHLSYLHLVWFLISLPSFEHIWRLRMCLKWFPWSIFLPRAVPAALVHHSSSQGPSVERSRRLGREFSHWGVPMKKPPMKPRKRRQGKRWTHPKRKKPLVFTSWQAPQVLNWKSLWRGLASSLYLSATLSDCPQRVWA